MLNLLNKPYLQYSLLDSLIILSITIGILLSLYSIKLGILRIKLYLKNRKNR